MKSLIKLQLAQVLFFITGIFMAASLPILNTDAGFSFWAIAKVFYFLGLIFFLYTFVRDRHKQKKDSQNFRSNDATITAAEH